MNIMDTVERLQKRADYVAGLRALADLLDENTRLPLPYHGVSSEISVYVKTKAELMTYLAAMDGKVNKEYGDQDLFGFRIVGSLGTVRLRVTIQSRSDICEKVVLGTREVVTEVPDPDALAAVPTITVTETVEDIEWHCLPLTAPSTS